LSDKIKDINMLLKKMSGAPIFLTLTKFLENNRLTILPIKSHDCHYVVHSAMFVLVWAFKCDNKNKRRRCSRHPSQSKQKWDWSDWIYTFAASLRSGRNSWAKAILSSWQLRGCSHTHSLAFESERKKSNPSANKEGWKSTGQFSPGVRNPTVSADIRLLCLIYTHIILTQQVRVASLHFYLYFRTVCCRADTLFI